MECLWAGVIAVSIVIGAVLFSKFKRMSFEDYRKKYDDL